MVEPQSGWKTVERPGWFGTRRAEIIQSYNERFGEGNWRVRHQLGPRTIGQDEALSIYELCYRLHFLHPDTRHLWLALFREASEVWTEEVTDVDSGLDYSIQKSPAVHYEDMAIRRIMKEYGHEFRGNKLIRIRADSDNPIGVALSSIHVPFCFPQYFEAPFPEIVWWNRHKGSLEYFWHTNKILQVNTWDGIEKL